MISGKFAVVYRWKLHPGKEGQFRKGWAKITELLKAERSALGSRLHQAQDGTWVAYAVWPDQAAWQRSRDLGSPDKQASDLMETAIAETIPPILLDVVEDHL